MDHASPSQPTFGADLDRCADERLQPALIQTLVADPTTRTLIVRGDLVRVDAAGAPVLVALADAPEGEPSPVDSVGFLGRDTHGAVLVTLAADTDDGAWVPVRELVAAVPRSSAEALVTAVSLGRWYLDAPFCPRCAGATALTTAGWARTCTQCGREHFPRTDPAVIVAVTDASGDRLLLGSNLLWQQGRFSCFAGFVEAGESLESAVRREVEEEAGVRLGAVRYHGSQSWPYPRSLMLGFFGEVASGTPRADGEEILEVRWFTRDEVRASLAGEGPYSLPGPASIAHELLMTWLGEAS